jgi:hypothetical protein
MSRFVQVNREEYLEFVRSYPRELDFDVCGISEPPVGSYNDLAIDPQWPGSVVAYEKRGWLGSNGEEDFERPGKFWKYYVLEPESIREETC